MFARVPKSFAASAASPSRAATTVVGAVLQQQSTITKTMSAGASQPAIGFTPGQSPRPMRGVVYPRIA